MMMKNPNDSDRFDRNQIDISKIAKYAGLGIVGLTGLSLFFGSFFTVPETDRCYVIFLFARLVKIKHTYSFFLDNIHYEIPYRKTIYEKICHKQTNFAKLACKQGC
jgi:hypothetical protein